MFLLNRPYRIALLLYEEERWRFEGYCILLADDMDISGTSVGEGEVMMMILGRFKMKI